MKIKKTMLIVLGCIGVFLGALGAVLPILPTVPFLMISACCFAKSSHRLNSWFCNTSLYKNNLEDYAKGRGMTWKCKCRIMVTVTLLMSIGFIMMGRKGILAGCAALGLIWGLHIVYFCFGVKTIRKEAA